MRMCFAIFMLPVFFGHTVYAAAGARHVECYVSGYAGCGDICVGAGVQDVSVRMAIDLDSRQIEVNGLKGQILGREPIDSSGEHVIAWRWKLIALNYLRHRSVNGRTVVTLTNHADELEFTCR